MTLHLFCFPSFLVSLFLPCEARRASEATVIATPAVKGGGRPGAQRGEAGEEEGGAATTAGDGCGCGGQ
uniref:Uncharacterized protein n=1 Tax=Oryza sativa subsp. japonica TaxID=39947 RepID=Q6ZKR0_ORYSJ|nr:hypothetical protein [Oryza sativa Japonica Group]